MEEYREERTDEGVKKAMEEVVERKEVPGEKTRKIPTKSSSCYSLLFSLSLHSLSKPPATKQ